MKVRVGGQWGREESENPGGRVKREWKKKKSGGERRRRQARGGSERGAGLDAASRDKCAASSSTNTTQSTQRALLCKLRPIYIFYDTFKTLLSWIFNFTIIWRVVGRIPTEKISNRTGVKQAPMPMLQLARR